MAGIGNKNRLTHGMSGTREYSSWHNMMQRCLNAKYPEYKRYGGRGITVCERWQKFENFYADMGPRPKATTLDRIDNDGDYEPDNCRWATDQQQQRNRGGVHPIDAFGETKLVVEWANDIRCVVCPNTLQSRLYAGWRPERAMSELARQVTAPKNVAITRPDALKRQMRATA